MKTKAIALFIATVAYFLDQLSKYIILQQENITVYSSVKVTEFFNLVLVHNKGISFGMFSDHDQPLILTAIAAVIIFMLLGWLYKNKSVAVAIGIGLIIGGAIGNVTDRLRYGAVVDFLDFYIGDYHWPAFNLADSFVFIGVVVLCVYSMFFEQKSTQEK